MTTSSDPYAGMIISTDRPAVDDDAALSLAAAMSELGQRPSEPRSHRWAGAWETWLCGAATLANGHGVVCTVPPHGPTGHAGMRSAQTGTGQDIRVGATWSDGVAPTVTTWANMPAAAQPVMRGAHAADGEVRRSLAAVERYLEQQERRGADASLYQRGEQARPPLVNRLRSMADGLTAERQQAVDDMADAERRASSMQSRLQDAEQRCADMTAARDEALAERDKARRLRHDSRGDVDRMLARVRDVEADLRAAREVEGQVRAALGDPVADGEPVPVAEIVRLVDRRARVDAGMRETLAVLRSRVGEMVGAGAFRDDATLLDCLRARLERATVVDPNQGNQYDALWNALGRPTTAGGLRPVWGDLVVGVRDLAARAGTLRQDLELMRSTLLSLHPRAGAGGQVGSLDELIDLNAGAVIALPRPGGSGARQVAVALGPMQREHRWAVTWPGRARLYSDRELLGWGQRFDLLVR